MRAAIYARRSTDEHQAASLETQLGEARRWCDARGWPVVATFEEDAVSRAEFKKRPALIAMLIAAEDRAFDVVVTRDETRLGGDMNRVPLLIQDLNAAGAQLWYYFTSERIEATDAMAQFMATVRAFAAQLEREKLAGRTRERLERGAREGHNVGGRAYGYDNAPVMDGARRVRVDYAINAAEAAVVREVFARYLAGDSLRSVAHDLNARGVPSPHAGRRGTGSWSTTTLRDLVRRERYRGSLVWGWRGSSYVQGTRVEFRRPASEWTRAERPDLAIVDAATWDAVTAKIAERARGPKARGGAPARSLLAGLARCAQCGGPMQCGRNTFGTRRIPLYQCSWTLSRGPAVCTNRVARPAVELDAALVEWVRANVLRDEVVTATLAETRRLLESAATPAPDADTHALEGELRRVLAEAARITTAIATTDAASDGLARALVEREARARELRAKLAAVRARSASASLPWREIEDEARAKLLELRAAFDGNTLQARGVLEALLRGPIVCTPVKAARGHRYRMTGEVAVPGLVGVEARVTGASPTRFVGYSGLTRGIAFALYAASRAA